MAITPLNYYSNYAMATSLTVNNTTPEITSGTPPSVPTDGDFLVALVGTMGTRFGSPGSRAPELTSYDGWKILDTIEVSGTAGQFQYTNTSYRLTVLTRPFSAGPWTFAATGAEQMTGIVIGFRGAGQAKNPISVNRNQWIESIDIPGRGAVPANSYYLIATLHGRGEAQWYPPSNPLPSPYTALANFYSTPQGSSTDPTIFLQGYQSSGGAPGSTTVYHWFPGVSVAIAFELSGLNSLEHLAWEVSDDLPTEDVTAPNFVRKALGITLPRPDLCPDEVVLTNPLAPTIPLYRGRPINPQVQGGQIRYELEGVEARWQRFRPKKSLIQVGPLTGKQALTALLTARQAEAGFIQWNTIPELYWPDGSIPTFPNLIMVVDSSDPRRKTVYDEAVQLLGVFPGYSLDFDANNRLRVVIPPFAPNALASKTLTAADGNFEETGYITTDVVRSVRITSKPYTFDNDPVDLVQPTTARYAGSPFTPYNQPEPDPTVGVNNRDRVTVLGGGVFETLFDIPFLERQLFDQLTGQVDLELKVWIYPEATGSPGEPDLHQTFTDTGNTLIFDGNEHQIAWFQPGDNLIIPREPANLTVYARIVEQRIRFRLVGSLRAFGGRTYVPGIRWQWWDLAYTLKITVTGAVWSQGTTEYSGQYTYEPGYSDLPDLDVSLLGIADNAKLQTLARYIAEYKSRQATRYALKLAQPWALLPEDKGRRVDLPGGAQVIPDSYRLGIAYGLTDVQAPFDVLAWKYTQLTWLLATAEGDLLATADGTVIEV